eukprot:scaffold6866_cov118-Isochrysis_galbana.AAC.5
MSLALHSQAISNTTYYPQGNSTMHMCARSTLTRTRTQVQAQGSTPPHMHCQRAALYSIGAHHFNKKIATLSRRLNGARSVPVPGSRNRNQPINQEQEIIEGELRILPPFAKKPLFGDGTYAPPKKPEGKKFLRRGR